MTVCIAAMCKLPGTGEYGIIGASDTKLTADDTQFEPPMPKVWSLTRDPKKLPSIVAMHAGDSDVPSEVCERVAHQQPKCFEEALSIYGAEITRVIRVRVQQTILGPRGLTYETFLSRRPAMRQQVVAEILRGIRRTIAPVDSIL